MRTWFIMQSLGLDTSLGEMAVQPPVNEPKPGFVFRKSDQAESGHNFHQMITPYGSITLHRADMLKVLTDNLPPFQAFQAHFSKRLVSYEQGSDSVMLQFSDGTSAEADVLVGADGVKSATRATMYRGLAKSAEEYDRNKAGNLRKFVQASWTGTYAYRALIETESLLRDNPGHQAATTPMIYFGENKHVVSYPISRGRVVNLVAFVTIPVGDERDLDGPAVTDVSKQEMTEQYKGWEPEVQTLLNCVDKPSRWAISHMRGLPSYVDGRVALLGDSAHAMATHLGAGAGQAIEDGFVLGQLLSQRLVTRANVSLALRMYDAVRRPFGNGMVERSRKTGFLYEFNELPEFIDKHKLRDSSKVELEKLAKDICKKWEVQWSALPDVEWKLAEKMLRDALDVSSGHDKPIMANL
ncbi:hypothetical protein EW145_g5997 [Phellinidium pouzarii]|uniref:FAD-binding domain-containing protein n=1 Tax=Phellinidium pouzarii TaxID=167371 RepID=A0A4S4KZW2_9AGAM|nr:hypothetical protein EW145_g5997 [Phellinidium pouzarii]